MRPTIAKSKPVCITRQTISEIENAAANPTIDMLDRIAGALGITVDRLFAAPLEGAADDDEIARRRTERKSDYVDVRDLRAAINEATGRPTEGFQPERRPRVRR